MMTREQIESIAKNCGVDVSYTEDGKGGFIIDSSNEVYKSVTNIFKEFFGLLDRDSKVYGVDESVLLAA